MTNLVIDAANNKIFFSIIKDNKSYTNEYSNSRENFDKIVSLLNKFLSEKDTNINHILTSMVAQSEHGENSQSILITEDKMLIEKIKRYV